MLFDGFEGSTWSTFCSTSRTLSGQHRKANKKPGSLLNIKEKRPLTSTKSCSLWTGSSMWKGSSTNMSKAYYAVRLSPRMTQVESYSVH